MLHQGMTAVARAMAIAGGAVLLALILMVCVSILGREVNGILHWIDTPWTRWLIDLGVGPVTGDFELVEAGMAFAIFAFLPICQITSSHASVDIFTSKLPAPALRVLRAVIEALFAAVLIIIAWRLLEGTTSKMRSGQTTFLLQLPIWWAYSASFCASAFAAITGVYTAVLRLWEALSGRPSALSDEATQ